MKQNSKENIPLDLRSRFAELSPAKRTILQERLKERGLGTLLEHVILRRPAADSAPLSFSQQRLWFLDQYEPNSSVYNISSALRLRGSLSIDALEQSLNEIIRRHESLRTTFSMVDGEPAQMIAPSVGRSLAVVDLTGHPEREREEESQRLVHEEARRPFDLAQGPLFRSELLRLGEDDHVLLLTMHHIVSDGWSMGVLHRELSVLYRAFINGESSPLADLPVQYADYAVWQREWFEGEVLERQLSYWRKQLEGIPEVIDLPTDRPRPAVQSFRGRTQSIELTKELTQALKSLSRKEGVTLFMTLLAAFQTLLYRYTGQEDIVVGSPVANRNRTAIEGLIGFFVNTLVLRSNFSGNPTFRELLAQVRQTALEAYEHQDLPFEKLVEELNPQRSLSHSPLFQVMFVLQNAPATALTFEGLSASRLRVGGETAKFDLTLSMHESVDGLTGSLQYNTDLFEKATIGRMLGHLQVLLESVVADPDQRVGQLALLTEPARRQLLIEWNDTTRDYPKEKCVHQLFEEQVERRPDAVAVVFDNQPLTYRELNRRANQLAHHLRKLGVGPETRVGICVERSLEMVIGLLGILKAGGAYVPLDPMYPKERLAFMLEDAQVSVLVTQKRLVNELPEFRGHALYLDTGWGLLEKESGENPVCTVRSENLAYGIYTSGSTGEPKGVQVEHRAVVNFLNSMWRQPGFTDRDKLVAVTTLSFDIASLEIFLPLCVGARIVLVSAEASVDGWQLASILETSGATVMQATPATWRLLMQASWRLPKHFKVLCGGEELPREVAAYLVEGASSVWNMYGPTEATIWSAIERVASIGGVIPIGRPIANTQIYILDNYFNPVPVGVHGELYIGGIGVARGYRNSPELVAEKFVPDPFSGDRGARLYKTGDRVRYLSDGKIEFLGRMDYQTKLRGFRIELGEVENVLAQHSGVREAVVLAREDNPGDKRLVAYVVPRDEQACTTDELRKFLKQKLPEYMIPAVFVLWGTLPITPNGKIDRKALPIPDQSRPEMEENYVAPHTRNERIIAEIWAETLKIETVGINDNFFDLGGHSLLAINIIAQLRKKFDVDVAVRTLFEAPTIAQLAARLETQTQPVVGSNGKVTYSHLVELRNGPNQKPIFCFPYRCGIQGEYTHFLRLAPYMAEYSFYGLQAKAAHSQTPLDATIEELAAEYVREIEEFQRNGPYYLIGDCAGTTEAYETARQLSVRGKKVGLLMLLDAQGPYLTDRYWRIGPYSIRSLDRLRNRLLRSRWGNLATATSFHWEESKKLTNGKRWPYLVSKAVKKIRDPRWLLERSSAGWFEEPEDGLSTSEKHLLECVSRARHQYRSNWPSDYRGRIAVIVNKQWYGFDRTFGWAGMAAGGIERHAIPGDHISYMLEYVPLVADRLRACLEEAQKEAPG